MIVFRLETPGMPGGSRNHRFVWIDGKPPRYWVVLGILFLVFVLLWILALINFERFGRPAPDSFHSTAVLEDTGIRFYPPFLFWLVYLGLFVVMAWMFGLGVIMAFKRKIVYEDNP
jgi:hypothetical protein